MATYAKLVVFGPCVISLVVLAAIAVTATLDRVLGR